MKAETVVEIYWKLKKIGIQIWLDGGWGVDALLGKQTREHNDIDIIIQKKDLKNAKEFFQNLGYKSIQRDDTRSWNFVLGDDNGNEIDFHVIEINEMGDGIYGPKENGDFYPASSLMARGAINNADVHCLSAEYQIASHTGYSLKEKDIFDVKNLCKKFKLPLPKEYEEVIHKANS